MKQIYPKSWEGTPEEWEQLCFCCGRCCHRSMIFKRATVTYLHESAACPYLSKDNACKVYAQRFDHQEYCSFITEVLEKDLISTQCAYELYCKRSKPHIDITTPEELTVFVRSQPDLLPRLALRFFGLRAVLFLKR